MAASETDKPHARRRRKQYADWQPRRDEMGKAIPTRVAETTAIISITRIVDNHAAALRRAHHFGIDDGVEDIVT